jgi:hypothetical protein
MTGSNVSRRLSIGRGMARSGRWLPIGKRPIQVVTDPVSAPQSPKVGISIFVGSEAIGDDFGWDIAARQFQNWLIA